MRERLIELLDKPTKTFRFDAWENTDKIADYLIANCVTIQKHGRWIGTHDGWYYSFSCSECGAEALTKEETMHDQLRSEYCPNCGALMTEGSEGE